MNDEELITLGEYPDATAVDVGLGTVRALVALVPVVGGAADELMTMGVSSPVQKRRDDWFRGLGAAVEKLARDGACPPVEKLVEDEKFVTATIRATHIAIGTHRGDKHRYLHNILTRIAAGKGAHEEMWGIYFRLIEDFGAPHMQLLRLFSNEERRQRSGHCHTYAQYISEGLGKQARNPCSFMYPIAIADMHARGLIKTRGMEEKFETTDVITYFGHGFLRFVAEYVPGKE
jgi:hypothetical protein